jgi:outer membrane protein TolC
MNQLRGLVALFVALITSGSSELLLRAQSSESYRGLLTAQIRADKLKGPQHLGDYAKDGKLSLSLDAVVRLALANNSNIHIEETQIEARKFTLLGAYQPFDPSVQTIANVNRYSTPTSSELQGVGQSGSNALNTLTQIGQISYSQTFRTGTNFVGAISSTKTSTNSSYNYFNPYFNSTLSFQFTQPLMRNAGLFANTASLVIARRSLQQSRASFEAEVNDTIYQSVTQYWAVVEARETLRVVQESLHLAEASYLRDKRALELGALPPLDIYRSQSEVASRKLQEIQGEYTLKQSEDNLRLLIGANRDTAIHALELELTEKPEPTGELDSTTVDEALATALAARPEIEAAEDALVNDATSIRLAHNRLLPDLELTGFYQSSGLGGNQYNLNSGALIAKGGFGSSFNQLSGFGFPGYGATLTLNLPIRNRAAQANLGSALVARHSDQFAAQQTREQIVLQVNDAVRLLEESKLTLEAGKTSYDLAQKSLAAEQRKFELGTETNYFVLDAQTKMAQADLDLLQTQINYQIARVAVEHATGSLLKPYHIEIKELTQ